jgi:hypothetical protein
MRHEIKISDSTKYQTLVIVKDADLMQPKVGLSIISGNGSSAQTHMSALEVDELLTVLQFYRNRLDFE